MLAEKWILIADDNEDDALFLARSIQQAGLGQLEVFAANGEQVFQCLDHWGWFHSAPPGLPDIIVLDQVMPRMTGLEVLRELRNEAEYDAIPVIMYSGQIRPEHIREARILHASAYIEKHIAPTRLQFVLRSLSSCCHILKEPMFVEPPAAIF